MQIRPLWVSYNFFIMRLMKIILISFYIFSLMWGPLSAIFYVEFLRTAPVGLPCMTIIENGLLKEKNSAYYLSKKDGDVLLAKTGKLSKGVPIELGPVPAEIFKGIAQDVSIEVYFCESNVVQIKSNDKEIFSRYQIDIDLNVKKNKTFWLSSLLLSTFISFFGYLLFKGKKIT